jgi:hypothetical protein
LGAVNLSVTSPDGVVLQLVQLPDPPQADNASAPSAAKAKLRNVFFVKSFMICFSLKELINFCLSILDDKK